jgi:cytochrome c biogenesis protein
VLKYHQNVLEARVVTTGETLPMADIRDLGISLRQSGYEVFLQNGALYAFKGISGRFAPIAVHVSLLAILFGAAVGALGGLDGSVMIPVGEEFLVANSMRGGITTIPGLALPDGAKKVVRLDKFDIDYRADGAVGQYRSVLSELDLDGRVERQKEIYVNEPMRFGGITIYQVRLPFWGLSYDVFRLVNRH